VSVTYATSALEFQRRAIFRLVTRAIHLRD
jgi:hypothetical protein